MQLHTAHAVMCGSPRLTASFPMFAELQGDRRSCRRRIVGAAQ